ncbi:Receptor-type tyrosine-protein phosphatase alpha [Geodia barretti]|uniref:protein-tyrosine-phosphatase n=1 Tax=Geodia barretti TaxID=519541 RepID=A0AA35RP95_GEOBA|nr:Receptor-type tyrosine-protein phosphatase alpha [Geodia barretti]
MKQILISTGTAALVLVTFVFICSIILFKRKDKTKMKSQSKYQESSSKRLERLERHELRERGWRDDDDSDYTWPLFTDEMRSDIPVSEFPDYVIDMTAENQHNTSKLAIEYQQLSSVPTLSYEVACLPQNINLNRFRNIYPYDDSRVPLKEIPGELGSDYINASFVSGYCGNRYIAAQAPLNETIDHFWRMVWEYEIEAIVMLTKCVEMTREKSAQYWPESLCETITPGDRLSVTLSSSTPYAEYYVRKLLVKHLTESDKSVTVTQFHYTAWPDHGVPDNVMAVIRFICHVRKLFPAASQDQPLLVHCSAGVGRTGTFITLDMMMQQMKAEATLSVCQCVRNLRTQRMKMVQTPIQYEFIHQALSELVVCGETEVTASSLRSFTESLRDPVTDSGPTLSQQHLKVLEYLSMQQRCDFTGAKAEANISKNRFPDKLPSEVYRVSLTGNSGSEYINASFINGYKQRDAYIATQGPLEETVEDFWRMMWEYQCGCIVMLCQLKEDGQESSYPYWPGEEGEEMVCGRLSVRLVKVRGHGDIVERRMEVKENKSIYPDILCVKMIQLTSWPLEGLPHLTAIMSLIDKLNHVLMSTSSKQTVVMCSDGVVRSGTFLVIHSQLERLKTEGVVDVFQAIKSAHIHRPGVIPNTDHYVFCYEVLADFVERMEAYHNFKTLM